MKPKIIRSLDKEGVDIFRINLSHTPASKIESAVVSIRKFTNKPICLDSEGAQVRTGEIRGGKARLPKGARVRLISKEILGHKKEFTLRPRSIFSQLEEGDLIDIDFEALCLEVLKKGDHFGGVSFFTGVPRGYSICSKEFTTLLMIKRYSLSDNLTWF